MPARMRWILPMSALLMIALGAGIAVYGETTLGVIVMAAGAIDLATMPLVLRALSRGPRSAPTAEPAAPVDPTQDPSYNPYARED